jgi:endonuclease/exonuclease/phosphatase family metal-dependent hydrolase
MIFRNLIFIILFVFSFSQTYPEIGSEQSLDIITWNIEHFPKNNQTVSYVTEIINDINVDIIALQEIENQSAFDELIDNLSGSWYGYRADDSNWGELSYLINTNNLEITHFPYTILDEYEHYFAYRTPYVMKCTFSGEEFVLINVHFKCCGDEILEEDYWDEEYRRLRANQYLKDYIDTYFSNQNVIVLGDFNDNIAESNINNIFLDFINDYQNYYFSDMHIAEGPSSNWSFPNWPSHLDHILITNELFDNYHDSSAFTFKIDNYMNGWSEYDNYISDHRPVGINFNFLIDGDINADGYVNVLDITLAINMILANEYSDLSDLNNDGGVNILDIVLLVAIILS